MKRGATTNDCENCAEKNICEVQNMMNNYGLQCKMFSPYRPSTNGDRLRAMSDEELAEKIGESIDCEVCKTMHHSESGECPIRPNQSCVDFWLDWLRQEVMK